MDELKEKGALTFEVNGQEIVLTEDDLLIDMAQMEGYVSEADNDVTVVPVSYTHLDVYKRQGFPPV